MKASSLFVKGLLYIFMLQKRRHHDVVSDHLYSRTRVIQFHYRKIPMHQQKFLVVSEIFNSVWLPRNLKMSKVKLLSSSIGNTLVNVLALTTVFKSKIRLTRYNFVKLMA